MSDKSSGHLRIDQFAQYQMDFMDEGNGLEVISSLMYAVTVFVVNLVLRARNRRRIGRAPYSFRDKPMSTMMRRVFFESELNCLDVTRMRKGPFLKLCNIMRGRGLLSDSITITVEEQMMMFMHTLGHASLQRGNRNSFGHSGETISRYFNDCLNAVGCLRGDYINRPPTTTPLEISSRPNKFYPYFEDCIGAIDGTHIDATVSPDIVARFRGRKDHPTQNILVAITYNMRFCFVGAGWEGSANDMTVLRCALDVPDGLKVPEGKYFLADAGYTTMPGFITPYRGVRYHLKEYSNNGPRNPKELFNLRHSSLRNTVERTIGVLKKRFRCLTTRSYYPYRTQVKTVVACAILHNYIMGEVPSGDEFVTGEFTEPNRPPIPPEPESESIPESYEDYSQPISQRARQDRNREWQVKRDELASQMWDDYRNAARGGSRG